MERLALIGGILLAAVVVLGDMVGDHTIQIDFDEDDISHVQRAAYVEPRAGEAAEQAYAATDIRVMYAAALVEVIPEDRTDVAVAIRNPGHAPMPVVKHDGERLEIDGLLARRINECRQEGGAILEGYGDLARDQLPQITLRVPRTAEIRFQGAVFGRIGAMENLDLRVGGCGRTEIADVSGSLEIDNDGSGEVVAAAARNAEIHLTGSGEASIGAVSESLVLDLAGSGGVTAASLRGALETQIAGSASAVVNGGAVTTAELDIAGSGEIRIRAPVERLEADIAGSGDIIVAGAVGAVDASLAGSGDVRVASVSGPVSKSVIGSGDVIVGRLE
ncbi:MAG: DUF2807 domain-containing protein [Hyphomonadaceae bacterium]